MIEQGALVFYQGKSARVLDNSTEVEASLRVYGPYPDEYRITKDIKTTWDQVTELRERPDKAVLSVVENAYENQHKKPNMRTLWEEVSEATLSWRGKHEHPLRLELVQIAGICINMIRQIDAGEEFKP